MSSDPKHIAEIRARVDALKAGDTVTAEDARELLSWIEVERRRAKYSEEQVVVGVRMSPLTYRYLSSLRQCHGYKHVGDVLAYLASSAADGIRRPGSWERGWVMQAFGDVPEGGPDASGYGVKPYEPGRDVDELHELLNSVRDFAVAKVAEGDATGSELYDLLGLAGDEDGT